MSLLTVPPTTITFPVSIESLFYNKTCYNTSVSGFEVIDTWYFETLHTVPKTSEWSDSKGGLNGICLLIFLSHLSFLPPAPGVSVIADSHSNLGSHVRGGLWAKKRRRVIRKKSCCILYEPRPVRRHMGKYNTFYIFALFKKKKIGILYVLTCIHFFRSLCCCVRKEWDGGKELWTLPRSSSSGCSLFCVIFSLSRPSYGRHSSRYELR